jgi:hypothetical protein
MIEGLPLYISIVFLLTTLVTVWFLFSAAKRAGDGTPAYRLFVFAIPFWMLLTGYLATTNFYRYAEAMPPRVAAFGVLPSVLFIGIYFVFFRKFVGNLPLKLLTLLHVVRVPVELVLLWLYRAGQVPEYMTFEGWNFDILSGITAILVYLLAFRNGQVNRWLLIAWNLLALGLLANIVTIAVLSFRSPMQQLAFEQPNVGVTYLPFIWLPAIVVPAVLFSHLAALFQLAIGTESTDRK